MKIVVATTVCLAVLTCGTVSVANAGTGERALSTCNQSHTVAVNNLEAFVPAVDGDLDCQLALGDEGSAVVALQRSLSLCHQLPLTEHGFYNKATEEAVTTLRQRLGLGAGNVYEPAVRQRMLHRAFDPASGQYVCVAVS